MQKISIFLIAIILSAYVSSTLIRDDTDELLQFLESNRNLLEVDESIKELIRNKEYLKAIDLLLELQFSKYEKVQKREPSEVLRSIETRSDGEQLKPKRKTFFVGK